LDVTVALAVLDAHRGGYGVAMRQHPNAIFQLWNWVYVNPQCKMLPTK
jgi:hypothetical protein